MSPPVSRTATITSEKKIRQFCDTDITGAQITTALATGAV
jgi:hypothetical protein